MKSFATSICPIKNPLAVNMMHPRIIPASSPHHPRTIPARQNGHLSALRHGNPAQRYLRGILVWRTIPQPISKRFLSCVITGLRHGDPAQRYLRAILAWQSVLLSGIRHDKLVHRYPRGIILWRSQTGHLPVLIHEIGFFHGR